MQKNQIVFWLTPCGRCKQMQQVSRLTHEMKTTMSMSRPHPEGYEFGCPEGEWVGCLDDKQWGQNKNLVLYFTDEGTGKKHWFSVFWADNYRARDGQIAFRDEEAGSRYKINTRMNEKGKPVFLGATKL